jgi:drug/metabolite transporter (DMT)-like permease
MLAISPLALVLVLGAAIFHAAWNLTLHGTSDRVAALAVAGLVSGLILLPFTLANPPWQVLPLIILSGLAECAYALALATAYRRGALALTYPIGRGTAPLLVTLGGWLFLSQLPSVSGIVGAALLALGLTLVATAGRKAGQLAAVGFALLVGLSIATYSVIDARAVSQVSPIGYLGPVLGLMGLLLVLVVRADGARLRAAFKPGAQIAVGSTAAYLLVLFAFQQAGAGQVATLREISVLIGMLVAHDATGWRVWVGAGLVVLGVIVTAV